MLFKECGIMMNTLDFYIEECGTVLNYPKIFTCAIATRLENSETELPCEIVLRVILRATMIDSTKQLKNSIAPRQC